MTTSSTPRSGKRSWAASRRRILGGIGASGLAAAGVIFGRPTAAFATVAVECCHLCHQPSVSIATCNATSGHYTWGCERTSAIYCLCCETKSGGCPSGVKSAVSCYHD
jgi:hypothetical protein